VSTCNEGILPTYWKDRATKVKIPAKGVPEHLYSVLQTPMGSIVAPLLYIPLGLSTVPLGRKSTPSKVFN